MKAWWIVSSITEIIFYYSIQDKMGTETVKQLLCSAELVMYKFDNFFYIDNYGIAFIIQQKESLTTKSHYNNEMI